MQRTANPFTSVRFRPRPPKRIFLPIEKISETHDIPKEHRNYLFNVLRLKNGDDLLIFNNKDGEFLAKIQNNSLVITKQTKLFKPLPPKALAFGLFRPQNMSWMIEKVTELGVTDLFPVVCEFSQLRAVNKERMEKIIIEASEQCGRCVLPKLYDPEDFKNFIDHLPENFTWHYGDSESQETISATPYGAIIGPEGGFSASEYQVLQLKARSFSMGNLILRSETACVASMLYGNLL